MEEQEVGGKVGWCTPKILAFRSLQKEASQEMAGRAGSDPSNITRYLSWGEDTREERYSRATKPMDGCAKSHGVMGRWKTTQEAHGWVCKRSRAIGRRKTTQESP